MRDDLGGGKFSSLALAGLADRDLLRVSALLSPFPLFVVAAAVFDLVDLSLPLLADDADDDRLDRVDPDDPELDLEPELDLDLDELRLLDLDRKHIYRSFTIKKKYTFITIEKIYPELLV